MVRPSARVICKVDPEKHALKNYEINHNLTDPITISLGVLGFWGFGVLVAATIGWGAPFSHR